MLLACVPLICIGCVRAEMPAAEEPSLLVLASASQRRVMPELAAAFQRKTGVRVEVVYGATGALEAQVENGVPGDVLLSADPSAIDRLSAKGRVDAATRRVYASGVLALVVRDGLDAPASVGALVEPSYRVIAVSNPRHTPYGAAAMEVLEREASLEVLGPKLVIAESVSHAYHLVRSGNADVGLVAAALTGHAGSTSGRAIELDPSLHRPIRHAGAVVQGSRHPHAPELLRFLVGRDGQTILQDHRFRSGAEE